MPSATYEQLLAETLPARIDDEEQYDAIGARFAELLTRRRRTRAEARLMDLLGILIADYDRRKAMPPDNSTTAELLQFLVEHSGKTTAELTSVFGTRGHVNEALNGRRPISADQARRQAVQRETWIICPLGTHPGRAICGPEDLEGFGYLEEETGFGVQACSERLTDCGGAGLELSKCLTNDSAH